MTSFKFPPPPPPPPRAASNDSQQTYGSQRGGNSRGGSDRGRGREGGQSRGSGSHGSAGNARGGYGQGNARGDARSRGGARGSSQNNRGGGYQRGGLNAGHGQQQQYQNFPSPTNVLPNAPSATTHNSAFIAQPQNQGQIQPQVDPNAFAQVMSFMSTPAGVQSMAAFASHMTGTGNAAPQYLQSPPQNAPTNTPRYTLPQQAGQKRKLGDRNHNALPQEQQKPAQQSAKPPRAKAAVAPAVPNFGFTLPTPVVMRSSTTSNTTGKKDQKKRKVNLGLTDNCLPEEVSEPEEDVDEEAAYAENLKGGGFAFEHEGEQITIRTAAEVAAWIKDRRKNFPTQQRIIEKAEETVKKRAGELEFLRKLNGKPAKPLDNMKSGQPIKARERKDQQKKEDPKKQANDMRRQEELAALRKKLHESMMKKQSALTTVNLGLGYESESEPDAESSVVSDSSVVSSSEESSEESDSEAEESDKAPEPISSKVALPPIRVPPPGPTHAPTQPSKAKDKICAEWERSGRCRFSNKCKFTHPSKEVPRVSLYERMVEQEMVKADQMALDAIKYLGQHGLLG